VNGFGAGDRLEGGPHGRPGPPPAVDPSVLRGLGEALDDVDGQIVRELVALYHAQAADLAADITEAARRGDATTLAFAAHSLKGSSANVGARRLADMCAALEHWTGAPPDLAARAAAVEVEVSVVRVQLGELLQALNSQT